MSNLNPFASTFGSAEPPQPWAPWQPAAQAPAASAVDREFLVMSRAFAPTDGIATADEVERLVRRHWEQPISMLARWIVSREVISFKWRARTLLPLFQFDVPTMTLRGGVPAILRELTSVFDSWELALWFAQANAWLGDRTPVDCLRFDVASVIDAARADRFIAAG